MFGDEIGVLAQSVAGTLDLDDDGMVEQSVEQRRGDRGITKDLAPLGEAAIGGEDHGAIFVAGVDQLEEEIGTARRDGQIADPLAKPRRPSPARLGSSDRQANWAAQGKSGAGQKAGGNAARNVAHGHKLPGSRHGLTRKTSTIC